MRRLEELQERAAALASNPSIEESISHLSEAFSLFSQETLRLETAYSKLQEELKVVNSALGDKVLELDLLSHYLANILKHMSQGLLFIDAAGILTSYNSAAEKILGKRGEEVLLQPYATHFDDDLFGFSMKEALKEGSASSLSFTLFGQKELEVETSFIRKGTKGLILLLRDITEMRRLQRQETLTDRLKELGEMAASVAHEIRNPLGGIEGYASLLQRDLQESPHLRHMADSIVQGARTLSGFVENVLHYTRPLAAKLQLTDLKALIVETCSLWEADALAQKISLTLEETPLFLPCDGPLLQMALFNLLRNAKEALPQEGGAISLALRKTATSALLSVSDTGVGIEPEQVAKLFSPFFTTKAEGTGLGLVEVYKIVQAHFGKIDIASTLGKGTTFTLELPLR